MSETPGTDELKRGIWRLMQSQEREQAYAWRDAIHCGIEQLERELAAERERADKARREGWEAGMREAADVLEKQARRVEAHGWFANAGTLRACAALLLLAIEEKKK